MGRQQRGLGGSIELGVYSFLSSLFLYDTIGNVWKLCLGASLTESISICSGPLMCSPCLPSIPLTLVDVHNAFRKL